MTCESSSSTTATVATTLHSLTIPSDRDAWIPLFKECLANTAKSATGTVDENCLYQSDEERQACRKLVEALAPDDDLMDHAANTSYAFWYLATQSNTDVVMTEEDKLYAAMREARRHYVAMNRDFDKALKSLTQSCQYRKEHKIDLLRTCFDPDYVHLNPEDEAKAQEMADLVRQDMERQFHILRGQDQYGQSVMIKYPRTKSGTTEPSYVMAQIYMAERSTAATEFLTRGTKERSVAVYNYIGFDRSMSPGFSMQVAAATQLQQLYPERLQTLVFVEPPFWLKGLLGLLSPFLSESITERIQWSSGPQEREAIFSKLLGPNNEEYTIPLLRKDGKLIDPVSLDHFLVDSPFFGTYDSWKCQRECTDEELQLHQLACTDKEDGNSTAAPSLSKQASSLWGSLSSSFSATLGGEGQ